MLTSKKLQIRSLSKTVSVQKKTIKCRSYAVKEKRKVEVLVVGAGTAGLGVASILSKTNEVAIIDPAENHYYQPAWTLVGGGLYDIEKTKKPTADVIPKQAEWIKDAVVTFNPDSNSVVTKNGVQIDYDYLFVTSGLQTNWDATKGLSEALNDPNSFVASNYSYDYAPKTHKLMEGLKRGNAVFTQPFGPIKCAGAPQKIMYVADQYWKDKGRTNLHVSFYSGISFIFGIPHYRGALQDYADGRGIETNYDHDLVEVNSKSNEAIFRNLKTQEEVVKKFSFLHATPKMSAPDFIKQSALADATGFVNVDKATLQHVKYPNVFSLGDCSNLPTSKTAAAIASQIPVAVRNFLSYKTGVPMIESYDGYTSCPIVTKKGKVILAEFDYEQKERSTFPIPFDSRKESSFNYFLKVQAFPPMYWHGTIKGNWGGPTRLPWKRFAKKH